MGPIVPPVERDTAVATIHQPRTDWMEVRFKPEVTWTREGIQEMMTARRQLGSAGRHRALMVLPDYVDFDLAMFTTDHHRVVPQPNTAAMAWATISERNMLFTRMYLSYFPLPFPCEVFLTEAEARAWLEGRSVGD